MRRCSLWQTCNDVSRYTESWRSHLSGAESLSPEEFAMADKRMQVVEKEAYLSAMLEKLIWIRCPRPYDDMIRTVRSLPCAVP